MTRAYTARLCWKRDPRDRPTWSQLLNSLINDTEDSSADAAAATTEDEDKPPPNAAADRQTGEELPI